MADSDTDTDSTDNTAVSPEEFRALQKRAKLNKSLLITVLIVCSFVVAVMGTGIAVLFMNVSKLNEVVSAAEDESMQEQFDTIDRQILLLADFRKAELKKINAFTKQLETIASDCTDTKTESYKELLKQREVDFQKLLISVKTGTKELASMSKGSKKWLDEFDVELQQLKASSAERSDQLDSL